MARPIILIAASVPIILAILIVIPMIVNPQIPFSATNADDRISIEFTKHRILKSSIGLTERLVPQKSEILTISNEGDVRYLVTEGGTPLPEKTTSLGRDGVKRYIALIKETGFMQIPIDSISADNSMMEFDKFSLKVTLNGNTKQIQWPEQNATSTFIPPIITMVGSELQNVTKKLSE